MRETEKAGWEEGRHAVRDAHPQPRHGRVQVRLNQSRPASTEYSSTQPITSLLCGRDWYLDPAPCAEGVEVAVGEVEHLRLVVGTQPALLRSG
eukprot:7564798-Pyramimonas_sp.AAC.1